MNTRQAHLPPITGTEVATTSQRPGVPLVEEQIRDYRRTARARYEAERMGRSIANLGRSIVGRQPREHTLALLMNPEIELRRSMHERARTVPAEVLYMTRRDNIHHRVYHYRSEERMLITGSDQQDRTFIMEDSYERLAQAELEYIHLGILQVRFQILHRRYAGTMALIVFRDTRWNTDDRSIIAAMEIDLAEGHQLIYVMPDIMLTIKDFFRHIQISIQTHGYESWEGAEANLLVTRSITARLSNTPNVGFAFRVEKVAEYLRSKGVKAIDATKHSATKFQGSQWNLRPSRVILPMQPSSLLSSTNYDGSTSIQFGTEKIKHLFICSLLSDVVMLKFHLLHFALDTTWLSHHLMVVISRGKPLTAAVFSDDGSVLAIAAETMITLWDPDSNILVAMIGDTFSPITKLSFVGKSEYLVSYTHGLKPQLSVWSTSNLALYWSHGIVTEAVSCSHDESQFAVLALLSSPGDADAKGNGVIFFFHVEAPVPVATWTVTKAKGGSLAFLLANPSLHESSARNGVNQLLLVFMNGEHEYTIFNPHKEEDIISKNSRKSQGAQDEAERLGYTSIYGDLSNSNAKHNHFQEVPFVPSERPWETIFSGSSHVLPPLTKLCTSFFESLMEKRLENSNEMIIDADL
ncbi:hypothetical protein ZIOFF_060110 [Zingiber officinale]|uniref:WD repeat-containing protein 75 second beta-propeller domain-containing protein n=1 Tax=Zingiber officinale TaxID=94328 RepID=A0A8J5FB95_ZINOF|nr:hypothetical protein ZIOFF_060110 [Zingiber officinale]